MNKNPMESINRSIDNSGSVGKLENKLTPEQKKDLIQNLELLEIKDFNFTIPVMEKYCSRAQEEIFKNSYTDIREAIISLSNKFGYQQLTQGDLESIPKWGGVIFGNPDFDKVINNGALVFDTTFRNYFFSREDENGRKVPVISVCEVLGIELNPKNLKEISSKYKQECGHVNDLELENKLNQYAQDNGLDITSRGCKYIFELDQKPSFEDTYDKEYIISSEMKISFDYKGHNIEISNYAGFDNNYENYLQDHDNPAGIVRAGARLKCKINGEEYKEKTQHVNSSKDAPRDFDAFQSWRKWLGYPQLT